MTILLLLALSIQQPERPADIDATFVIDRDGVCKVNAKTMGSLGAEPDTGKIDDFFMARRQLKYCQEKEGSDTFVKYTLFLKLDPETPIGAAQRALMSAARGGVTRIVLLTDWAADAQVRIELPRAKRLDPKLTEVRVIVCAGGDLEAHEGDPQKHAAADKKADACAVRVGDTEIGRLKDEGAPALIERTATAAVAARDKARAASKDATVSVVLDADKELPARHAVAILRALKAKGLSPEITVTVPMK